LVDERRRPLLSSKTRSSAAVASPDRAASRAITREDARGMQRAALGIGRTLLSGTARAERNTAAGVLPLARPPPSRAIGNSHRRPIIKAKLSQEANRLSRILEEDSCPADAGDVFTRTAQQRTRTGTSRRSLAWVIKVGAVWSALDVGLWTNFGGVVVM